MSQPAQMAGMGGPVGGGPQNPPGAMNAGTPGGGGGASIDAVKRLNTAIYDYLLRNQLYDCARSFVKAMDIETDSIKKSPGSNKQANGVSGDEMEVDNEGIRNRPEDLPPPLQLGNGPFLHDWWCQFWEIYSGYRGKGSGSTLQYIGAQRQAQKARGSAMLVDSNQTGQMGQQGMPGMAGRMPMNGADLRRGAMQNPRNMTQQQLAQMQRMQNPAMQGQGMERQGSQIDMTRSGSPNSGEAPSPKRQRLEGNMQMQQGRPGPTPLPQGNQQVGPPFSSPTPTMTSATLPNTPHMQHTPHLINTPTSKAVPVDPARLANTHQLLRDRGLDPTQFPPQQLHLLAMQPANHQQKSVEAYSSSIKQSMAAAMNSANKQTDTPSKGMPAGPQGTPQQQPQQTPQGQQGQQQGAPTPQMQAHMQGGIPPPGMPDAQAQEFYANNGGRPGGMGAGQQPMQPQQAAAAAQAQAANTSNGNHALQDYQMQLMLLEQQNKKRLLMARQEQDSMAHPAGVPANGQGPPQGFGAVAPGMSPQGSRAGDPSPGPGDMGMPGRGTPKIGKAGMSPNGGPPGGPEMGRASPSPAQMAQMHAGPGMMPPGQQPPQMVPGPNGQPMMRPPSSHPNAMGQPMTAEQMRMMSGGMQLPNGQWAQGGPQQSQVQPGPNMTPRQGNQPMPPPPPPGQQGAQPSSPAQGGQPPTPNQNAKNKGGKKDAGKKGAAKKGGNTGATPASEGGEAPPTPTPATPITPMHQNSFNHAQNQKLPNGQQPPQPPNQPPQQNGPPQQQQQAPPPSQDPNAGGIPSAPFGNLGGPDDGFGNMNLDFAGIDGGDVLDNFDFDSFLNTNDDGNGLGGFDANFAFDGTGLEAGMGDVGGGGNA
ncbi:hypothetical protein D0864_12316 [Hortaea werneckii]|uniref:Uncharacterized protein n=1 Tax=Hortaea werneckii TaxID=91943 RepID=A0A3M7DK73_HORWE|nr:hypothetical protein D0864_12316 [Hortaea werneckii]